MSPGSGNRGNQNNNKGNNQEIPRGSDVQFASENRRSGNKNGKGNAGSASGSIFKVGDDRNGASKTVKVPSAFEVESAEDFEQLKKVLGDFNKELGPDRIMKQSYWESIHSSRPGTEAEILQLETAASAAESFSQIRKRSGREQGHQGLREEASSSIKRQQEEER